MITPRRPLPARLIRKRFRPLPAARGLRRRSPDDNDQWQPVGLRWRRVAARPVPARIAPRHAPQRIERTTLRERTRVLPSRSAAMVAPMRLPSLPGQPGSSGRAGRPGAPGAPSRIEHRWGSRTIVRATTQPVATMFPARRQGPGAAALSQSPPAKTFAGGLANESPARPKHIEQGFKAALPRRAAALAWQAKPVRRAITATGAPSARAGQHRIAPPLNFNTDRTVPAPIVKLDWFAPRASQPTAAALARQAMRAELVWRAGTPRPASASAPIGQPLHDAPTAVTVPGPSATAFTMPPNRPAPAPIQLDAALTERLVEDVLRRAEQRLRIERERRGL
ncbi:MAG: hypothetical protein ABIT83_24500 [Massilia sp.]